ncbi:hypothetical protein KKF59_00970 [Patescibacteria group bacterium]|nr:hypothetical protein [Patescibacteria group bacterium]MBU1034466.1 hypothetical protein [Patescibacteria group bacterium]MBU1629972.1 hypothetical protein [Patescibacteria group bacterium]MBU1907687.1 hypothetical protein [Patescibacteria group bacterium]
MRYSRVIRNEDKLKRHNERRAVNTTVIILVVTFIIVGGWWFLMLSGFWDIHEVEINGLQLLSRGEVLSEVDNLFDQSHWRPWHKKNLIMLDTKKFQSDLKKRLFVQDLAVDKFYPNILRLIIKERQRSIILVSNNQYISVDTSGVVTGTPDELILSVAKSLIAAREFADELKPPVIVMPTADPLTAGFQIAQPEQIRRWLDVTHALVVAGVKVRFMKIESPESSLARFVSEKGYDIYFDLSRPIDAQIASYDAFMKTKPDESKITEHLDVRIPGRVFIK